MRMVYLVSDTNRPYFPGSWSEQPAWFMQALEIYRAEAAMDFKKNAPKPKKG